MKKTTIHSLFSGIEADIKPEWGNLLVNQIHYDSRKVGAGDLFIAITGYKIDGHNFLELIEKSGASAAVVERKNDQVSLPQIVVADARKTMGLLAANYYKSDIEKLALIGITGTNGKTTTSFLVRSILEEAGIASGLIGTIAYYYGDQEVAAWNTTPEALDIGKILSGLAGKNQKACVLEVSSHALSLDRVAGFRFDAALFTNLSRDHMDFYATEQEYFEAKCKLFDLLKEDGTAAVNIDDPWGQKLVAKISGSMLSFGFSAEADVRPLSWDMSVNGLKLKLKTPEGECEINSRLIGDFNIQNILAAVSAGLAMKIDLPSIRKGIEKMELIPGRLENVAIAPGITAVIDYAHTPDALEKALSVLKKITAGRLIVVFGCGGDRDRGKRPQMGRIAELIADLVFVTDDNPRTENPQQIIDDILKGMSLAEKREVVTDRKKAIHAAIASASKGDVILIAGKGHETYQDIGGVKYDFDERVIIKEAVQND